jgi:hypothetical protein
MARAIDLDDHAPNPGIVDIVCVAQFGLSSTAIDLHTPFSKYGKITA